MFLSTRSRLWAGLAAGVLAAAATASAAQAATQPSAAAREHVPAGLLAAALPGASAFGDTPSDTPEQVSFIMKERGEAQLEAAVTGGLTRFASVSQFAAAHGASPAEIGALRGYLSSFGITTTVLAGNVDVSASGTAGEFDQALSVTQKNFHVPAQHGADGQGVRAQSVRSATAGPQLPASIASGVLAVLGLTNYAPFVSSAVHVPGKTAAARPSASGDAPGSFLPSDFAQTYGLDPLYNKTDGAGQTLAIVTLAALDPNAPQTFWQQDAGVPATGRSVTVDDIDGGPGAPSDASGSGETDLDVEQSGGLAPGANVIVYQGANSDSGFIDSFFTAAAQNKAATLSTSWGEAETALQSQVAGGTETPAYQAAFDEAFLQLADQGQSVFDAAGDGGAYDDSDEAGSTNLDVDTPADSPYATAAGGTTLPWSGPVTVSGFTDSVNVTVPAQRAWAWDYLWPAFASIQGQTFAQAAVANAAGGGGGFSTDEPRPSYQLGVSGTSNFHGVQYLTPDDPQEIAPGLTEPTGWDVTATPAVVSGTASGRAVPDLSADADPFSGYLLYEPSFAGVGEPVLQPGWGGTSFVAPQFNGSAAVIDAYVGHRTGLWNPALYALANSPASPVTPLNDLSASNDNLFFTGNPGERYNAATGLGVPDLAKLAADLAR